MWIQKGVSVLVLSAVALLSFGCDSSEPAAPILQGEYSAIFTYTVDEQPFQETWTVTLNETSSGMVSGSGLQGSERVEVSGNHDHPDITLDFVSDKDGFIGTLTGTVTRDGDLIEGRYNFSIVFVDIPITMRKVV